MLRMGEMRNACRILSENDKDTVGDLVVYNGHILKHILKK
jgi:hypothetical protein